MCYVRNILFLNWNKPSQAPGKRRLRSPNNWHYLQPLIHCKETRKAILEMSAKSGVSSSPGWPVFNCRYRFRYHCEQPVSPASATYRCHTACNWNLELDAAIFQFRQLLKELWPMGVKILQLCCLKRLNQKLQFTQCMSKKELAGEKGMEKGCGWQQAAASGDTNTAAHKHLAPHRGR